VLGIVGSVYKIGFISRRGRCMRITPRYVDSALTFDALIAAIDLDPSTDEILYC
jgi:hypothetical protein